MRTRMFLLSTLGAVTEKAAGAIALYAVDEDGLVSGTTAIPSSGSTPFGFAFTPRDVLVASEAGGGPGGTSAVLARRGPAVRRRRAGLPGDEAPVRLQQLERCRARPEVSTTRARPDASRAGAKREVARGWATPASAGQPAEGGAAALTVTAAVACTAVPTWLIATTWYVPGVEGAV